MAWNGSGVFNRLYSWVSDAAANIKIRADRMDAEFDNFKSGLDNCLTRDGQGKPSANLDINAKKLTNLANGTSAQDAVTFSQLAAFPSGRKNLLKNASFKIWQAGTSQSPAAGTGTRTADCWWAVRSTVTNWSVSRVLSYSDLAPATYGVAVQRTAGSTDTQAMYLCQSLETVDSVALQHGQTVTFSAIVQAGANFSAAGGILVAEIWAGTGTDQNLAIAYDGATLVATANWAITTTHTRFSVTGAVPSNCNELAVRLAFTPVGTAGASDAYYVYLTQLEIGSSPTSIEYRSYSEDLFDCQRYYYKTFAKNQAPAQNISAQPYTWLAGLAAADTHSAVLQLPLPSHFNRAIAVTTTTYNPFNTNTQPRNITRGNDAPFAAGATSIIYNSTTGWTTTDTLALHYVISCNAL